MNIKHFLITTAVIASISTVAMAAGNTPVAAGTKARTAVSAAQAGKPAAVPAVAPMAAPVTPMAAPAAEPVLDFKTTKAQSMKSISAGIDSMQKKKSCMQKASSLEAIAECRKSFNPAPIEPAAAVPPVAAPVAAKPGAKSAPVPAASAVTPAVPAPAVVPVSPAKGKAAH